MDGMLAQTVTTPSTCWECSALCGSLVTVEAGRATLVSPNPAHPHSHGAFCVKGIRGLKEMTYADNRILHPMRRTGPRGAGGFEAISPGRRRSTRSPAGSRRRAPSTGRRRSSAPSAGRFTAAA